MLAYLLTSKQLPFDAASNVYVYQVKVKVTIPRCKCNRMGPDRTQYGGLKAPLPLTPLPLLPPLLLCPYLPSLSVLVRQSVPRVL